MEPFIPIIWFLLVLLTPVAFVTTACISLVNGAKLSDVVLKLGFAFLVYVCMTAAYIPLMFIMVFAGAHSEPVGNALDLKGEIFSGFLVFVYGAAGWLLCSLISGKLIKPRQILDINREKPLSIL